MARLIQERGLWIIRDEWCADDILEQAEQIGEVLTPEEVHEVLVAIVKFHDSNIGINNESIQAHIDCVVVNRRRKKNDN
jgi:hypothetical protein